jgi:two-component system, OmpR family, phosphate regulon sensor histidine kinase PhoR
MEYEINTYNKLLSENDELRMQLEEANDTIQAIRTGQVDAFIVQGENGNQLYTLKTADQTYRVFIEKMNEGAVTLNRDGLILYSNSRFATMMGIPLEKVLGLSFEKFIPAGSVNKFNEIINNGWEEDYKEEITLLNKDGEEIPCLLSCNTLEMDEGIALSLILTDLTIQKEAEKQLKTKNEELEIAHKATEKLNDELEDTVKARTNELLISREHFRLLANNIPQMTWTSLPSGEANFYNQQWYDYTQLNDLGTKEAAWRAVVHPDDLENTIEKYNLSLASGNIFEVENRYKNGIDGNYRWHLNRAIPLRNDAGEIILWVGTATDIEDQKREMERKDEFIGIASHELKTPLTSLKGYLQLIASYKKEELPVVVKTYINKANIAINKLQHLVNDLLDVSKIQAGRLEYRQEKMDISILINTCVESAAHIYPAYVFENQSHGSFLINGNTERLEQVVMNLINNAVKYSPESKRIIIETVQQKNFVRVSVIDFGIGLTNEQIERIFERFYRVEDKKYMTSGLGMGLYISTEIINAHHGKIGVSSEPGKGSNFYFDLPLVNA